MSEMPIKKVLFPVVIMLIMLALAVVFSGQIADIIEKQRAALREKLFPEPPVEEEIVAHWLYIDPAEPGYSKLLRFFEFFNVNYITEKLGDDYIIWRPFNLELERSYTAISLTNSISAGAAKSFWPSKKWSVAYKSELTYAKCWSDTLFNALPADKGAIYYDCGPDGVCSGLLRFKVGWWIKSARRPMITLCDSDAR